MATPENTFIQGVHKYLPADLYRMKNHNQYNGGIADVWYSGHKADLWIEYKFLTVPKRDDTIIDLISGKSPMLSHLQQDWLESRHKEGRNIGVIVGCKAGGVWFGNLSWTKPNTAKSFCALVVSRSELAHQILSVTER